MKNLRVALVRINKGVDQSSTYEEILACTDTKLYPLTDFFQAQNDEELPNDYWSFLLDIEKEVDLTGTNINGIHQNLNK